LNSYNNANDNCTAMQRLVTTILVIMYDKIMNERNVNAEQK